ncbi:hypothetical protein CSC13_3478 [Klebsiella pneumoniae]|uniref:Uncharacterized protein n=2 Tax=Klebsiella pneumoniae TaxID=573 RepID=A0A378BD25_KLEPO|nr:hypothetical protein CSC13_3478 [Klebsiella pneumoniae]SQC12588.1 Uncharacterised protein [Klebsiella pneumoniae]STS83407.1 Uncharacterised protein [Klebsiella pneumoniae]STV34285.1 Uncharacterised protein [Klebsiella pneumoniae subsp. ozaenae]VEB08009.1 Uncharacterised protein [Klebsiella pneumoniae]
MISNHAMADGTARRFIRIRNVTPAINSQYPRMTSQFTTV